MRHPCDSRTGGFLLLDYPLSLRFRILSLTARIDGTDAAGRPVFFMKQKGFRFKEDVEVWRDESRAERLYRMRADRMIDFSATYSITGPNDEPVGAVRRKGARSIWRATYEILDARGQVVGTIHEENPWLKVLDSFIGGIPFLNMLINPAYLVDIGGRNAARVQKQPAFFEGKFTVETRGGPSEAEERLVLPSVLMMLMLERQRG